MIRPRKLEVDSIVTLLEQEHDDVHALASEVIHSCYDLLMRRELWLVLAVYPDQVWTYGPYFTRGQAEKAIVRNAMEVRGDATLIIRRLITSTTEGSDDA